MLNMSVSEALNHARLVPEATLRADIRRLFPFYIWIRDNYDDFDGWNLPDDRRKLRLVHCEACDNEWIEEARGGRWPQSLKQGERVECPKCRAAVIARHMSRGFKGLRRQIDVVWYTNSIMNPHMVVACATRCERDYGLADADAPWTLETDYDTLSFALFREGHGARKFNRVFDWRTGETRWEAVQRLDNMTFGSVPFQFNMRERVVMEDSLYTAIEDTPFMRAWSPDYLLTDHMQDGAKALSMIARYPCVEYLTKLYLTDFVRNHLAGVLPNGLLNWRGKTMAGVLKISRPRLSEIKGAGVPLTPGLVAVIQYVDKAGIRCGARTASAVAAAMRGGQLKSAAADLERALSRFPKGMRQKAIKYIAKTGRSILDVEDYWRITARLGGDLRDSETAFPRDFAQAHDRAAGRVRYVASAKQNAMIEKRLPALEKQYGFSFGGLILRPVRDVAELAREGEVLHHCVGSYASSYASGQTVICVLRRAVEPDVPFRTVEIGLDGRVKQDRGLHNDWGQWNMIDDRYRAMLDLFWAAWRERRKAA